MKDRYDLPNGIMYELKMFTKSIAYNAEMKHIACDQDRLLDVLIDGIARFNDFLIEHNVKEYKGCTPCAIMTENEISWMLNEFQLLKDIDEFGELQKLKDDGYVLCTVKKFNAKTLYSSICMITDPNKLISGIADTACEIVNTSPNTIEYGRELVPTFIGKSIDNGIKILFKILTPNTSVFQYLWDAITNKDNRSERIKKYLLKNKFAEYKRV